MTTSKMHQLNHAHFEHKLWRNELELVQQEATFFLKILEEYKTNATSQSHDSSAVAEFINQFHHFQRLTKRLLEELSGIEKEVAQGVKDDNVLDSEQRKDRAYLNEEMKYFESDYREVKYRFRNFIATDASVSSFS